MAHHPSDALSPSSPISRAGTFWRPILSKNSPESIKPDHVLPHCAWLAHNNSNRTQIQVFHQFRPSRTTKQHFQLKLESICSHTAYRLVYSIIHKTTEAWARYRSTDQPPPDPPPPYLLSTTISRSAPICSHHCLPLRCQLTNPPSSASRSPTCTKTTSLVLDTTCIAKGLLAMWACPPLWCF